jgi:hypothetical protein
MAHDLHCECVEMLEHQSVERYRAERKMKKLAAALFETDSQFARKVVAECNAEGGLLIDDPLDNDGQEEVIVPPQTNDDLYGL